MLTAAYLRSFIGGLGPSEDRVLEELERAAVGYVQDRVRRTFSAPAVITEYLSGNGGQSLELRSAVTTGAPTIYALSGSSWSEVTADVEVSSHPRLGINNLVTRLTTHWPYGLRNIKATYTGGYAAGAEPGEIRLAVARLVSIWYPARVPGGPTTEIPADLDATLARWRYPEILEATRLVRG